MRPHWWAICLSAWAVAALSAHSVRAEAPRPNIVHIFADDLGWGSFGFNGQARIETPNLDALASAGMRFNHAYSSPVCAASRAMLLTGLHQGHASIDGNDGLDEGFRAEVVMSARVLAPAGYTSAVIGKWGFGADGVRSLAGSDPAPSVTRPATLPTSHGFDEFYGYLNHGAAHDYFYSWMWRNNPAAPNGVSTVADFNRDGAVDAADYTLWRDTFGSTADLAADADGNGMIDHGDYAIWKANFGAMAATERQRL